MEKGNLPPRSEMVRAFLARDAEYEGTFFTGVTSTGIFCRPTCAARKPNVKNVEFFANARDAMVAGLRPCRRCNPVNAAGVPPEGLQPLLEAIEHEPSRRRNESDLVGAVVMRQLATPIGPMIAGATAESLCLLEFADRRILDTQIGRVRKSLGCIVTPGNNSILDETSSQLAGYFNRELTQFSLPLKLTGSEFQVRVWQELQKIPHGTTVSYAQLAAGIGRPTAMRAVAGANGANRIGIIIPCHRVIGSDGRLTGYGGGLWRKQRLLELEGSLTRSLFE